jgi:hypothetical protein
MLDNLDENKENTLDRIIVDDCVESRIAAFIVGSDSVDPSARPNDGSRDSFLSVASDDLCARSVTPVALRDGENTEARYSGCLRSHGKYTIPSASRNIEKCIVSCFRGNMTETGLLTVGGHSYRLLQ